MDNLFGQTPWEVQQGMNQQINQSADAYAKLDPFQRAAAGMHRAGGMLAGPVAGMLGMENPAIAQSKRTEQIMGAQGTDLSSSEGLLKKAEQFRQAGDLRTATALAMKGQEMRRQEQAALLATRKQDDTERRTESLTELQMAQAVKALRENPNLVAVETGVAGRPGWTQTMLYDKTDPNAVGRPIGEPKQSAAAMRVSVGGGESKQPVMYVNDDGKVVWGTMTEARGKPAAQYDPTSKQSAASASAQGTAQGKDAAAIGAKEDAKEAVGSATKLLDKGIYTGGYAKALMTGAKYIPGADKTKVANTEQFLSDVGNIVIPRLQEFGGNDSVEELKYLRQVSAGEITMEESAIRNVLASAEKKIARGIERAKTNSVNKPAKRIKFDAQGNMVP